ncbi:MAG TPA: hypothetical protein VGO59_15205 [Verrucomicrobiae bacterium]|jgi:hypothetical protein
MDRISPASKWKESDCHPAPRPPVERKRVKNLQNGTTNWTSLTNFSGDGSIFQFVTPASNIPALFFRVEEP